MQPFSLFAQAKHHPYSDETVYRQFIDETFPTKTSRDLNLTRLALSAILHNRNIPKCVLGGTLEKRVQFFQETYSVGSEAFKKTLLKQIEKKKQEINDLTPATKESYLEKHIEISSLDSLKEPLSEKVNKKNLSFILTQILPLQNSLSLSRKSQYSLSLESLTTEITNQFELLDIIHVIQNLDSKNPNPKDYLENKLQFITQVKRLTENMPNFLKTKMISLFSHLDLQDRLQLFNLIQSSCTHPSSGISRKDVVYSLVFIYSQTLQVPFSERSTLTQIAFSLIRPGMQEPHILTIISELALIPSDQRVSISRLVQILVPSKILDLSSVITLIHLLTKNNPKNSYLIKILSQFTTYSQQERSIFIELFNPLKLNPIEISSILSRNSNHFQTYNPTYIAQRDHTTSLHQDEYLKKARKVIDTATNILQSVQCEDTKPLFFQLISYLSKHRGLIAQEMKIPGANLFGVRRDFNKSKKEPSAFTTRLESVYQECGAKVLSWLTPLVKQALQTGLPQQVNKQYLGYQSILQVKLLDKTYIRDLPFKEDSKKEAFNIQRLLQRIENPPTAKTDSFLVEASLSMQIKEKKLPLSQYYTWVSKDSSDSDVLHFSEIILLHQNHEFVEETLDEAAQVFDQVMNLDEKNLISFQEQLALLTYILAHNARDRRGSAAETEWLVHAICLAKNLHISEDPNCLQDLEAFSSPLLSDYIRTHKDMIKLQKK